MNSKVYNWGILGAGHISEKFVAGLKTLENASCYAVAARDLNKAENFAVQNGIQKAYGSYKEMLADDNVDVVYVGTINTLHFEHVMMCLEAGKHVLCEKPFASNYEQVILMTDKAKEKGLFLMEALWSRFLPSVNKFKNILESGKVGEPALLRADFGFKAEYKETSRLFDQKQGGGSVPDIGIYPLFLSLFLFGYPMEIKVLSEQAPTGVDMTTAVILKHRNGVISQLTSTFACNLDTEATIYGTNGKCTLKRMFHMPTDLEIVTPENKSCESFEIKCNGYEFEAEEVMQCLDNGLIESPKLTHDFSKKLIKLIDEVLEKCKL